MVEVVPAKITGGRRRGGGSVVYYSREGGGGERRGGDKSLTMGCTYSLHLVILGKTPEIALLHLDEILHFRHSNIHHGCCILFFGHVHVSPGRRCRGACERLVFRLFFVPPFAPRKFVTKLLRDHLMNVSI